MQIVIDIPEELRIEITRIGLLRISDEKIGLIDRAIQCGTVLEPHGRCIDADAQDLRAELWTFTRYTGIDEMPYEDATQTIDNAPTILEATEGDN